MKIPKLTAAERAVVLGDPMPEPDGVFIADSLPDAARTLNYECAKYREQPLLLQERVPGLFDFWLIEPQSGPLGAPREV